MSLWWNGSKSLKRRTDERLKVESQTGLSYLFYKELELNLRIKPKQRIKRETPEPLSVPTAPNEIWSMDFMHDQLKDGEDNRGEIRCDNGPEYISTALQQWAKKRNIKLRYIQPGKPQQNAYIERYNRTVRYDWLNQHLFENIEEVQHYATKWLWVYSNERANTAIGGITPKMKLALVS